MGNNREVEKNRRKEKRRETREKRFETAGKKYIKEIYEDKGETLIFDNKGNILAEKKFGWKPNLESLKDFS